MTDRRNNQTAAERERRLGAKARRTPGKNRTGYSARGPAPLPPAEAALRSRNGSVAEVENGYMPTVKGVDPGELPKKPPGPPLGKHGLAFWRDVRETQLSIPAKARWIGAGDALALREAAVAVDDYMAVAGAVYEDQRLRMKQREADWKRKGIKGHELRSLRKIWPPQMVMNGDGVPTLDPLLRKRADVMKRLLELSAKLMLTPNVRMRQGTPLVHINLTGAAEQPKMVGGALLEG